MKSTRFSLNWRDLGKGLIVTMGAPILYYLQTLIPLNTSPELKGLLSVLCSYLIKNYFTDDVKVAEKVIDKATEDAVAERKTNI